MFEWWRSVFLCLILARKGFSATHIVIPTWVHMQMLRNIPFSVSRMNTLPALIDRMTLLRLLQNSFLVSHTTCNVTLRQAMSRSNRN